MHHIIRYYSLDYEEKCVCWIPVNQRQIQIQIHDMLKKFGGVWLRYFSTNKLFK